jgi:tetrahydromethanopterin S-methyltransferase subunit F
VATTTQTSDTLVQLGSTARVTGRDARLYAGDLTTNINWVGGIASGSLHGWLWLVAGFSGGIAGVYLRIWLKVDKPLGVNV